MRIGAVLDKKSKKLECVVQQVAFSNGRVETQLTAELKGEKKKKRVLTSSMPYLFTKLDFHVISGGEVWKYSRALESYTQSIGVTIYTKPKKVGRKRLIDTLTATAASEATNYNDISNLDDLEEAHIDKALTSLQQVRASMFNESIHVSFLSIDPDILCVRCTNTASLPVSFAVEQLFTDADEWGQLQALRALGSATPLTESVADTMLRLTALSDCLKETCFMDKAIDSIKHHVFIRANAAYCLAKYQNEHAPRLSTTVSAGSWIAMKAIITAYLQYYYIFPANYLTARQPANSSIGGKIPGPFSLDDIADTHLRCALLLALSSVHARSGATPFEAIQLLLNQAENVHASTISAALAEGAQQNDGGPSSYDDSHVCSVVLLALSRIRVSTYLTSLSRNKHPTAAHGSGKPPSDLCYAVLHRIRVVAAFYLERDLVFSVSVTEQDEEVPARREKRVVTAAGGILTASALQCLCEVDCQLHPVTMARPSAALLNSDSSKTDVYESSSTGPINYFAYLDSSKYSPLVRSAAIECILKLMVYSIADQKSLMSVPEKCERRTRAGSEVALAGSEDNVFYAPQPADLLSVVMFVVSSDPDVCVRRNAAQAFLSVTQGVSPLRMIESAISLGSVMDTFDWSDPSGFTAINGFKAMKFGQFKQSLANHSNDNGRDYSIFKDAFDVVKCIGDDTSSGMSAAILQLKSLIGCHRLVASDQTTRCLLFRAWLVLFGAESPKALQSHELIAKNNILGNFQFLNPPRLVVPHPIQSMNDVNDVRSISNNQCQFLY